ncbi:MAG: ribonuclease P protein component [Acidobacteriota bacterium]|nr:ribonuclease P protein component [Acidobacteriota bacterium]MDH3783883.1 ribonuclease P protein component [Acidobacteriota bacterium]
MIPRACYRRASRLTSRQEFLHLYAKGRRVKSTTLTVFTLPNNQGHARLGVTATRKVGGAVRRNRAKRWLRELFRQHQQSLGSADVVINAHPRILESTFQEVQRDFLDVLRRLRKPYFQPAASPRPVNG